MRLKSSADIAGKFCLGLLLVFLIWLITADGLNFQLLSFAAVIAVVGLTCLAHTGIYAGRLRQLKRDGLCYPAVIVDSIRAARPKPALLRVGSSVDTVFVCVYTDGQGRRHEVQSRRFFCGANDIGMRAVVYVDKHNPQRYAVEVFQD